MKMADVAAADSRQTYENVGEECDAQIVKAKESISNYETDTLELTASIAPGLASKYRENRYSEWEGWQGWKVVLLVAYPGFLGPVTTTMFLPALKLITQEFHCSATMVGYYSQHLV